MCPTARYNDLPDASVFCNGGGSGTGAAPFPVSGAVETG